MRILRPINSIKKVAGVSITHFVVHHIEPLLCKQSYEMPTGELYLSVSVGISMLFLRPINSSKKVAGVSITRFAVYHIEPLLCKQSYEMPAGELYLSVSVGISILLLRPINSIKKVAGLCPTTFLWRQLESNQ